MKFRMLVAILATFFAGLFILTATPAMASTDNPCGISGWYVNPDESGDNPSSSPAGFFFDNKDLIHHATEPIDLADIKVNTLSFVADTPGKVLGKMETANPYSTIVQNDDGKFWSTAMTYDQEGGQGHPVEKVSDLVGKDTKPGKAKYDANTKVVTFGVGYAIVDGSTTVSSIKFHGYNYDLTCKVTPSTSASTSSSPKPSATVTHKATSSSSVHAALPQKGEPALPVTGVNVTLMVIIAVILLMFGAAAVLFSLAKRRKQKFQA